MDKMDDYDSALECEAIWLLKAMTWICDAGYTNVVFESDVKVVIDTINSSEKTKTEFDSIIGQCQALLHQQTTFSVGFIKQ